jgi:hypothetical protein
MALVGKEIATELMASSDPDVALVYACGSCVVRSVGEAGNPGGVIIARRRDIPVQGGPMTDDELEKLAVILDNMARDLGG